MTYAFRAWAAPIIALALSTSTAWAAGWTLDNDQSRLSFGSIKSNFIGEVHHFKNLSGHVNSDGNANISIDLSSVETNIDIRNERMIEHVFKAAGNATLTSQLDLAAISTLPVGGTTTIATEASLSLLATDTDFDVELFVARLGDDSVLVTTNDMVFLDTDEAGIDPAIDILQELASLDSITRSVPVTLRFVFTQK